MGWGGDMKGSYNAYIYSIEHCLKSTLIGRFTGSHRHIYVYEQ